MEADPFLDGVKLLQPALFAVGSDNCVRKMYPGIFETAGTFTPNLKQQVIIPGASRWRQQERSADVNQLFIEFLRSV